MTDGVMEKLEHIERLILQLNDRIDNFLEFEDLTSDEKEDLKKIRREVQSALDPRHIFLDNGKHLNPPIRSWQSLD
jgi:hypothetical protein